MREYNMSDNLYDELEQKAKQIRLDYLRYVSEIGKSHVGGCLSMCDIVVALHYHFMTWHTMLNNLDRDRFILSKGHCSELLYIIYSDMGLLDSMELVSERLKCGGRLSGHADRRFLPMIDASTGSLGHGLGISCGMAMANRLDKSKHRVFCLLGDGEMDEGSNWEALMYAAHNGLDNLFIIIDRNGYSSCANTESIIRLENLNSKLKAFGCEVISVEGNNMKSVCKGIVKAFETSGRGKPIAIISNTQKGYGLKEAMESPQNYHHHEITKEMVKNYD